MEGLTELDAEVLERVRQNREKNISKKQSEKIESVIIYKDPNEKSARQKIRDKKNEPKESIKPEITAVKTSSDKKPQMRGTTKPKISYDGDTVLLTWTRHYIKEKQVLLIPSELDFSTGMLELCYNTKDKVLTIKPLSNTTEGKQASSGAL